MPAAAEPLLVDLDVEAVEEPDPEEPEEPLPLVLDAFVEAVLADEAFSEPVLTTLLLLAFEPEPVPDAAATPPDGSAAPVAGIVERVEAPEAGPEAGTLAALG